MNDDDGDDEGDKFDENDDERRGPSIRKMLLFIVMIARTVSP